ncbi:uncharacterized protein LOC132066489 [Lycium ferocissimum]|uniref:uncharacterized protein LOC132066489 n=1 Tax=Lycium ferocissimum TaxID=112874 RepID=UPI0028165F64|nr:uncharacterized protein LOC132066489 [Lycium ferocissimum]
MHPYGQVTITSHHFNKLSYKYYGPYLITKRIGPVACKLALPPEVLIHLTFHVSLLKFCHALPEKISHPPVLDLSNPFCPQPVKILSRRMVQKRNKAVSQWEDVNKLKIRFPSLMARKFFKEEVMIRFRGIVHQA